MDIGHSPTNKHYLSVYRKFKAPSGEAPAGTSNLSLHHGLGMASSKDHRPSHSQSYKYFMRGGSKMGGNINLSDVDVPFFTAAD